MTILLIEKENRNKCIHTYILDIIYICRYVKNGNKIKINISIDNK